MDAYAKLNLPRIKIAGENVAIDGLYSEEEYQSLKKHFEMVLVAVHASEKIRHERLGKRKKRSLNQEEAKERDISQLQNLNIAGPIAKANYTIINEASLEELEERVDELLEDLQ
jgi:dephospho-CoA kinase